MRLAGATGPVSVEFDRTGLVRVVPPVDASGAPIAVSADLTQPVMIGDTGLVITATGLGFTLDSDDPTVSVTSARLLLPPDLAPTDVVLPELTFTDAVVSRRGFSGTLAADWDLTVVGGEVRYTGTDAAGGGPRTVPASMFGLERRAGADRGPADRQRTGSRRDGRSSCGCRSSTTWWTVELGVDGTGGLTGPRRRGGRRRRAGADPRGLVRHACRRPSLVASDRRRDRA